MKRFSSHLFAAQCLMLCAAPAGAADYWAYQYKDFDVVAQGSAAYAASVARHLDAVDQTLQRLLSREPGAAQSPTHVYALQPADYAPIDASWVHAGGAFFRASPFDQVLVVPSENDSHNPQRALYAARVRAWLDEQGLARMPGWFKHGLGLVVGAATVDNEQLILGQEIPVYMARLKQTGWISVEYLLFLPPDDPQFHKSAATAELYDAECWWLAHLILLDGVLDKSMSSYLARMIQGQDAVTAYATSFNTDIESLDKYFRKLRRSVTLRQNQSPMPTLSEVPEPLPVDAADLKARLAQLAVLHDVQAPLGKQWATEVLKDAPDNERALTALINHELGTQQYQPLLVNMQQLQQRTTLSAAGHGSIAAVQIALARRLDSGVQGLNELNANSLRADARSHLRHAMELDATSPLPVYTLGWLLASQGDVAAVQQLLPAAEQAFYERPYNANLAALLMRLHTLTGNSDAEFKFAVATRRLATTETDRYAAQRRIDRLRPAAKSSLAGKPGA
jgi:hypothetical protein